MLVADCLTVPALLHAVGLTESPESAPFRFELAGGETVRLTLTGIGGEPVVWRSLAEPDDPASESGRQPSAPFRATYREDAEALYVQFDRAAFHRESPITRFVPAMLAEAERREAGRLVLDLRRNHGGDARWNEPILRALIGHPRFDRHGRLFVLIGPRTQAEGQLLANELERHTHALFVGEPSGSGPAFYGDPRKRQLPNSGLTVRISTLRWSSWLAGEYRKELPAHLPVPRRFEDFRTGRDAALERALGYRAAADPGVEFSRLLETDVNHAALWALDHVSDPANADRSLVGPLLRVGRDYLESGDLRNARFTFQIGETVASDSADLLGWLGVAHERLGRAEDAIGAYRRALELDDDHAQARAGLRRMTEAGPPTD